MNGEFSKSRSRRKYLLTLQEINMRLESITDVLDKNCRTTYEQTNIEFVALQLRKIFELIVFSSMISHKQPYAVINPTMNQHWRAKKILSKIEAINPKFYPKPVSGVQNKKWKVVKGGYLTRKQLERYYDLSSGFIHAKNPFSLKKQSDSFYQNVPLIVQKIQLLLEQHIVTFPMGETLYIYRGSDSSGDFTRAIYLTKC